MEPAIGEIVMFGGNFAPRGWALCHGQLLPISQNTALFSILGTTYGGDGRTTFGLPDLRGRVCVHAGHGNGLTRYNLGEKGGSEDVFMTIINMPSHNHSISINGSAIQPAGTSADTDEPTDAYPGQPGESIYSGEAPDETMAAMVADIGVTMGNTGGGLSINNVQPILSVNYIIALQGVFPFRN
ncbi:MAG: tail fiber protein [Bacteroidota bacterium]